MYKVNQEQLSQLGRIFNTLMQINTQGENTMMMCDCLRALQQVVEEVQKNPIALETLEYKKDWINNMKSILHKIELLKEITEKQYANT